MFRRIVICLIALLAGMSTADARPRHIDATPFSHAPCSVLDNRPCTPSFCSVFNHGPCIPEIDYPYGENLQLTIETVPPQDQAAKYQKPDHDLDSIGDLFAALRSCWSPPPADSAREGMQMSVRFSFKRSGEIIAAPRLTYSTAGVSADTRADLPEGRQRLAGRLHADEIHRRPRRRAGRATDRDPLCRQSRAGQAVRHSLILRPEPPPFRGASRKPSGNNGNGVPCIFAHCRPSP